MSKEQYVWLSAMAMISWRQLALDDNQSDPLLPAMEEVTGISGRLSQYERQAANEIVAVLLFLLLIYAWNCAKYLAISSNGRVILCQMSWCDFLGQIPLNPADCLKIPANWPEGLSCAKYHAPSQ